MNDARLKEAIIEKLDTHDQKFAMEYLIHRLKTQQLLSIFNEFQSNRKGDPQWLLYQLKKNVLCRSSAPP